jgi:hypothetical protein
MKARNTRNILSDGNLPLGDDQDWPAGWVCQLLQAPGSKYTFPATEE